MLFAKYASWFQVESPFPKCRARLCQTSQTYFYILCTARNYYSTLPTAHIFAPRPHTTLNTLSKLTLHDGINSRVHRETQ